MLVRRERRPSRSAGSTRSSSSTPTRPTSASGSADAGWKILYVPAARAVHHDQMAQDAAGAERRIVEYHRNQDRYLRKHEGRAEAFLMRPLLAWPHLLRAFAALFLPGHSPRRYWLHARQALRPAHGEGIREAAEAHNRRLRVGDVRILEVTQMWPSPEQPDLGSFLVPLTRELEALGHEVDVSSISQRGGSRSKYLRLVRESRAAARRFEPDVVFAHFLFPSGAAGAIAARAAGVPLVVMAHGQDVANLGRIPGVKPRPAGSCGAPPRDLQLALARRPPHRADPGGEPKVEIADCGVDLDAFSPRPAADARRALGWDGDGPAFLCVGSLIERKNVVRLAEAFGALGRGRLAFVGDGPLRGELEGRPGVTLVGRVPQAEVPRWVAACDVLCQPSLREPFGQATLEAMAMERSVVATQVGGPPEFVTPEAGVLVDPEDTSAMAAALAPDRRDAVAEPRRTRGGRGARRQADGVTDVRGARASFPRLIPSPSGSRPRLAARPRASRG